MIGKTVDGYKIESKLGEGGMGEVYLAEEQRLGRRVALKFLSAPHVADEESRARFLREARSAASLNHPNIVTIYGFGEYEDSYYIAMEYIEGELLSQLIRSGEIPLYRLLDITIQICKGLHDAHQAGIIHRDIKSKNIILDSRNRIKILDFGTAKLMQAPDITIAGTTFGTLHYLSPEQVADVPVDHRSDIFSLGVLFYEMLTGNRPFQGEGQAAVLYSIMHSSPKPLSLYRQKVPAGIKNIMQKALCKEVHERYQSAEEMLLDLRRELKMLPIESREELEKVHDLTRPIERLGSIVCILTNSTGMQTRPLANGITASQPPEVIQRALQEHGGELLESRAKGMYCSFRQSYNAVQAAMQIQDHFNSFGLSQSPLPRSSARIGIHRGDLAELTAELNRQERPLPAKIAAMASNGGILITQAVYDGIRQHSQFHLREVGEKKFDDSGGKQRIYQVKTRYEDSDPSLETLAEDAVHSVQPHPEDIPHAARGRRGSTFLPWIAGSGFLLGAILIYLLVREPQTPVVPLDNLSPAVETHQAGLSPEIPAGLNHTSQQFGQLIRSLQTPEKLDAFLQSEKRAGRLNYGPRNPFFEEDGNYVVIIDNHKIYDVLLRFNNRFHNLDDNTSFTILAERYRGKIDVWIESFEE